MVPDKPQKVENFHFTWCGYIGIRTRYYVKLHRRPEKALVWVMVEASDAFFRFVQPSEAGGQSSKDVSSRRNPGGIF